MFPDDLKDMMNNYLGGNAESFVQSLEAHGYQITALHAPEPIVAPTPAQY